MTEDTTSPGTDEFGLTPEIIHQMQTVCDQFGELLRGLTGPQIALVFASCISSWLSIHTTTREQADAVRDFVFDKVREGLDGAELNHMTHWTQLSDKEKQ